MLVPALISPSFIITVPSTLPLPISFFSSPFFSISVVFPHTSLGPTCRSTLTTICHLLSVQKCHKQLQR